MRRDDRSGEDRIGRVLLLDILNHPTFSFRADFRATIARCAPDNPELEVMGCDDAFDEADIGTYEGVIISGSITPYCSPEPWVGRLRKLMHRLRDHGRVPVLAICMAHELVADMYGGAVQPPRPKKELGTVRFRLTEAGTRSRLYQGFPLEFEMLTSHSRDVIELPAGAIRLASNSRCENQSFQLGNLYCVQFHAEVAAECLRGWLLNHGKLEELIDQGFIGDASELDAFLEKRVYDTPFRYDLFRNFLSLAAQYGAAQVISAPATRNPLPDFGTDRV